MNITDIPARGALCKLCKQKKFILQICKKAICNDRSFLEVDCITCPICATMFKMTRVKCDIINDNIYFCDTCKILFQVGCVHAYNGYSNNIFYGKLIYEIMDKESFIKRGMPIFESYDDMLKLINNVKYKWLCMCEGNCSDDKCVAAFSKKNNIIKCECNYHLGNIL